MGKNFGWRPYEERYLEANWGRNLYKLQEELQELSGIRRTIRGIEEKAAKLGLGSPVRDNPDYMTVYKASRLLGVSTSRAMCWINKYGLKAQKKELRQKTRLRIRTKDLVIWLETHQELWDSRTIPEYSLGIEPDWMKDKREHDASKELVTYTGWPEWMWARAQALRQQGKYYYEIADELGKSTSAVYKKFKREREKHNV